MKGATLYRKNNVVHGFVSDDGFRAVSHHQTLSNIDNAC
jgi:hypothetical protein